MKILVTGGCGMIGFHVANFYNDKGDDVVVIDNFARSKLLGYEVSDARRLFNANKLQRRGVAVWERDVADRGVSVGGEYYRRGLNENPITGEGFEPDVIFHMAAQTSVPTSIANPFADFRANTVGTFRVLELARECDARVVYASTNKVYPLHDGWELNEKKKRWEWSGLQSHLHGFPVTACDNQGPRTPYGVSKFTGDLMCQEWHHIYGVPTGIFRMSCIFGDHQFGFEEQGWATWFAIATLKGLPINIYGDGMQVRDMLWVGDVVKAYDAFAISEAVTHGVWNTGGGTKFTLSLLECLDILEEITGKRSEITFNDWRPSDQRIYTSDIRPLEKTFGWEPKVSPKEGLTKVVEWAEPILEVF